MAWEFEHTFQNHRPKHNVHNPSELRVQNVSHRSVIDSHDAQLYITRVCADAHYNAYVWSCIGVQWGHLNKYVILNTATNKRRKPREMDQIG